MPDPQSTTVDETRVPPCDACGSPSDRPCHSIPGLFLCRDCSWATWAGVKANIDLHAALRSQPAPVPPTESEGPKVGERWGTHMHGPARIAEVDLKRRTGCHYRCVYESGADDDWMAREGLKGRLSPPAPEATATEAPVAKVDPYGDSRPEADRFTAATMLERDRPVLLKRRADTLRDLDRPLTPPRYPSRYACVGVMGDGAPVKRREVKGAPSTWPSVDSGPGWED